MQSTTAMRFVDTNILLYAVSTAAEEQPQAAVARALLEADDLALSVQVLQEFYVQATRAGKAERDLSGTGKVFAVAFRCVRIE